MMPPRQRMLIGLAGGVFIATNVVTTLPASASNSKQPTKVVQADKAKRPPNT